MSSKSYHVTTYRWGDTPMWRRRLHARLQMLSTIEAFRGCIRR